ncbi:LysR family transcriptional regulator [Paraburkholderia phosphatilytica]|uniref:LysR family transcriptional regulator n=1 Tax=Paraburkholderia phosphatilytica TaxID=2282883 RepID=UPI000E4B89D3|nr:LysR family transcriptional regulator [Paraburkholderia phosphatilytica]
MRNLLDSSLYYFSVVAQSGSLTAATDKLGATVSALSRHIAKLEGDVGAPLFERHARGMVLSDAGRMLLRYAQSSLADGQAVMSAIQGDLTRRERNLRIACTEGFALDFLPNSLAAFYAQHPDAVIAIEVTSSDGASRMLVDGDAAIALSFSLKPEPDVVARLTLPAPVMALMSRDHPLAARPSIALADLHPHPVLLQDTGTTIRQLFDIACNVEGIDVVTPITSRYVASLYRFTQVIPGAIMLSGFMSVANRLEADGLVAVPFASSLLQQRRLQVKTSATRPLTGLATLCLDHLIADLQRTQARHPQPA